MSQSRPSLRSSSLTSNTKMTGPYDAHFEQTLIDNGVYPKVFRRAGESRPPDPKNIAEIRNRLARARPSLSPSAFSENAFEEFRDRNDQAISEQDVMMNVVPTIIGKRDTRFYHSGNVEFTELQKFHPSLKNPKPDRFYGAQLTEVDPCVCSDLAQHIVPSDKNSRFPIAPNSFLEGKGPSGRSDVLQRQAMYAGAVGARGILGLQNYRQETPSYDGNAYTTTSTYHSGEGSLKLYTTYPTLSATDQTEYRVTPLRSYAMTDTSDNFRQGAAAYRNAVELAQEQRDRFIANANTISRNIAAAPTSSSTTEEGLDLSSHNDKVDASSSSDPCVTNVSGVSRRSERYNNVKHFTSWPD